MKKQKRRKENENGFEQWGGYMNAKISKLEAQFDEERVEVNQKDEKISDIFKGISIFVNGYTEPSADELRCLMLLHGGVYHHYYRSGKTTHVIASTLPNAKFDQMKTLKVVKCEWITDSVKAGKLLNYGNYLLQNNFPEALQAKKPNLLTKFNFKKDASKGNEFKVSKTAADEGYLTEFYSNSRLHYISTLGNMLKQYVSEMREKHNGVFLGREKLLEKAKFESSADDNFTDGKVIMHIDMDCFFVSVALRNYPHLKGQPVAVTHAKTNTGSNLKNANKKFEIEFYKSKIKSKVKPVSRGSSDDDDNDDLEVSLEKWSKEVGSMSEIASCSYEARKAGVRKGMYLGAAKKLCPDLKTVPYDFNGYKEVSMALYNTVAEYTLDLEPISCDELFVDCTSLLLETKISPFQFAETLRKKIEEKTNCTSSVGIASNKLQARLATKRAKPNGQFHLTSDEVENFMKELNIYDVPGIGRTIGAQLKNLAVKTCGDLQKFSLDFLRKEFGIKTGETLFKNCRGLDDGKLNFNQERKSVSAEINYGIRFNDDEETELFLKQLSEEVSKRLKDAKMMGKRVTFKVMFRAKDAPVEAAKYLGHGACETVSRSLGFAVATNEATVISKHVIDLYRQLNIPPNELRGIGIHVAKLKSVTKTFKTLPVFFEKNDNPKVLQSGDGRPTRKSNPPEEIESGERDENSTGNGLPPVSELDFEVLASLPESIRLEILNEYGIVRSSTETGGREKEERGIEKSEVGVEKNVDPTRSDDLKIGEATRNFLSLNQDDLKLMIREWVTAENHPENFDVIMLENYLKNLVEKKKLESLCVLIRCLHRYIEAERKENEAWRRTYDKIVDAVQVSMLNVFGRTLASETI